MPNFLPSYVKIIKIAVTVRSLSSLQIYGRVRIYLCVYFKDVVKYLNHVSVDVKRIRYEYGDIGETLLLREG